jgi:hypothetical protein
MCILCTGFVTTAPLTRLKNIGDILDGETLIDMGSLVFTSTVEEKTPFRA